MAEHAFDGSAQGYDETFTDTRLGRWMRERIWEELAVAFTPGQHVLELGCGTGEDALWLARRGVRVTATDASAGMVETTRQKLSAAGVVDRVVLVQLDMNAPASQNWAPAAFDGVLSNFGAINCVADRRALAQLLARHVRIGGRVALVVMSPLCPWEIGWHMLRGQPRVALRRLRAGAQVRLSDTASIPVWYPSPARLAAEFAPAFRRVQTLGIGAILPPPYLESLVVRWPGPFSRLASLERRFAGSFPWTWLNDHYLMIFERR